MKEGENDRKTRLSFMAAIILAGDKAHGMDPLYEETQAPETAAEEALRIDKAIDELLKGREVKK